MKRISFCYSALAVIILSAAPVLADVFNMAPGLTSVEMVPIGNPGNAGEQSRLHRDDETYYGAVSHEYNMGKFEVTCAQYTEFLNAVADSDPHGLYSTKMWSGQRTCMILRSGSPGSYTYSVPDPLRENRPVNYVSFWDAARFCNWLHNGQGDGDTESGAYINIGDQDAFSRQADAKFFIPTEDEWYKAAYHKNDGITGNYFRFPTSSDYIPHNEIIDPDPGNNANGRWHYDVAIGAPYYTTPVGEFENSRSPYGTFDQAGNVWEWNETVINTSPYYPVPTTRNMRGGGWDEPADWFASGYTGWYTDEYTPSYELYETGFRVASAVPEPSSFTMLMCGALGLVACGRRRRRS